MISLVDTAIVRANLTDLIVTEVLEFIEGDVGQNITVQVGTRVALDSLWAQSVGPKGALATLRTILLVTQELVQIANWISVGELRHALEKETDLRVVKFDQLGLSCALQDLKGLWACVDRLYFS